MAKRKSSLKGTYIFSGGKGASQEQIKELRSLLHAYRHGIIKENTKK